MQTPRQPFPAKTQEGERDKLQQPPSTQVPFPATRLTGHVLIQGQGHSHVTDLDGFKVAFNDHVGRLDISVEQLLIVVKILRGREEPLAPAHGHGDGEAGGAIPSGQQNPNPFMFNSFSLKTSRMGLHLPQALQNTAWVVPPSRVLEAFSERLREAPESAWKAQAIAGGQGHGHGIVPGATSQPGQPVLYPEAGTAVLRLRSSAVVQSLRFPPFSLNSTSACREEAREWHHRPQLTTLTAKASSLQGPAASPAG